VSKTPDTATRPPCCQVADFSYHELRPSPLTRLIFFVPTFGLDAGASWVFENGGLAPGQRTLLRRDQSP
jgi:hypothetical protein